jgi:hypothetical protein
MNKATERKIHDLHNELTAAALRIKGEVPQPAIENGFKVEARGRGVSVLIGADRFPSPHNAGDTEALAARIVNACREVAPSSNVNGNGSHVSAVALTKLPGERAANYIPVAETGTVAKLALTDEGTAVIVPVTSIEQLRKILEFVRGL